MCGWRIMLADQPSELIGVMCSSWRQQSREAQQLSLVTVTKPVSLDPALHQLGLQLFSIKAEELRREQQPTTHYPNHYTYQYQCFPYMHLARGGPLKPRHWPCPLARHTSSPNFATAAEKIPGGSTAAPYSPLYLRQLL